MSRAAQASQNGASGHSNGATASKSGGNPLSQSLYGASPPARILILIGDCLKARDCHAY